MDSPNQLGMIRRKFTILPYRKLGRRQPDFATKFVTARPVVAQKFIWRENPAADHCG
jgi:hypothetical protein